jgi:hypothetical protein
VSDSRFTADAAELIASLPALLGYSPDQSVTVIATSQSDFAVCDTPLVELCARRENLCRQLASSLTIHAAQLAVVIVVAPLAPDADDLPHRDLVVHLGAVLAEARIEMVALWTAAVAANQPFSCYSSPTFGTLPDPRTTALAAATVRAGRPLLPSDTEVAAQLTAEPDDVLQRRALLLARTPLCRPEHAARLVREALHATAAGDLPTTDEEIVSLAVALSHPRVRNSALPASREDALSALGLWMTLTRQTPLSHVAAPATLTAVTAWLQGHGALTNAALDKALDATPGYRPARRFAAAAQMFPPQEVQAAITAAGANARASLRL